MARNRNNSGAPSSTIYNAYQQGRRDGLQGLPSRPPKGNSQADRENRKGYQNGHREGTQSRAASRQA